MSFVSLPGKMGNPLAASRFNMNSYNGGNGNFDYLGMYKNGGDYSVPASNTRAEGSAIPICRCPAVSTTTRSAPRRSIRSSRTT